jgi:hypothetical protein
MMNDPRSEPRLVLMDPPPARAEQFAAGLAAHEPVGMLVAALSGSGEEARGMLRSLVVALIEDGKRFAATSAGARWAALLAESPAVANGLFLWNQANIDLHLRNAAALPDSPAALLDAVLRHLATLDLASLATELGMLAADVDAAQVA